MIKGVIFDMDGVIIDSNGVHYKHWNDVFKKRFNLDLPKDDFASRLGENARNFTEYFLDKYNVTADVDDLIKDIMSQYNNNEVRLKEGVKTVLKELKQDYKIALATGANKEWAVEMTTHHNIANYFDFIIAGNEVKRAKPDPEIFLKAAESLKLQPDECVVIEDAFLGITAAKRAGMFAVSIQDDLTKLQDHSKADLSLESIKELNSELLNKLGEKNG